LSDLTGFSPNSVLLAFKETKHVSLDDFKGERLFKHGSESLKKLVNVMLQAPEIRSSLQGFIEKDSIELRKLPAVITDWVQGRPLNEIADKYFDGLKDPVERITECVSQVYTKLSNSASWGLAAVQQLSVDFKKLSEDERMEMQNLPSMIYYGVSSKEAIALRKAGVTRSMAQPLGEELKAAFGNEVNHKTKSEVLAWIKDLDIKKWDKANPHPKVISGKDYKLIWEKLSGV
jgi:hypothetical protein